ncbi:InlB B-repeat-containing protein [Paenibacillus sp. BIHB 4019]|nr:InlB B-repeat-containing protein [Paenibacillus sp. BIHB 4019]
MGKKFVSRGSMLLVIFCMAIIVFLNSQSVASANIPPTPIFASEDTTIIYEGINAGSIYEDGNLGYLDVGYQGTHGNPLEVQVLLKFDLPTTPEGYEVETANLYIPVSGGHLQPTTSFSLKISTSTDHSWIQDSNITSPPTPTSGSTQTRTLASNVPLLKPTLAPFNFTSYILGEFTKTNPKATFILSGMTAQEAASNGINSLEHYIQMTETNMGNGTLGPYLIITYSQVPNIEITGVVDGGIYNTNVIPQFNVGSATLNGSSFTSGTTVSNEGTYTLTVTAGSQQETIQFRIDKTPPTGTIIVNLGNQYTNSSAVSISISPDAGVTDITHIQYSVNGAPFTQIPYVPSFMLAIGITDGDKVLKFKLVDRAGNASIEYERTITRDTVVPTGSIVINDGNVYTTNSGVTLNLSLGNGVTDVVAVQFSNNNSSWSGVEAFSSIKSYTLPAGDGNKTVYVRLIDRAGNITIIQDSIILDTTPPTGTVVVNNGSAYTNNANVNVDITPDAGVTDIANIRYSINGGAPTTIAYMSSFQIDVGSTDGLKAITIRLIDHAGNESSVYSSNVTLDTEPPTGTVAINGGAAYTADREVTLEFALAAGVTDVASVQLSNDNLSWSSEQAYSASMSYTLPAGDGSKTVYVRFIDRAGNTGLAQASIALDNTAPIVTGVTDGQSYDSLRTIAFNEGTATLNGNVFINGSTVDAEGSYVLIVTDEAGNSITITFSIFKYRVSYDGNGATEGLVPVDSQTYETGNTVSVVDHIGSLVKTGFTFIGWNTEANGSGTSYVANDTFTISRVNVTLYATWEMNHYTVSFESDGGNVVANQTKSYNELATEPDVPTKSGFIFGGWYKEMTLTNQWSFDNDRVTANTTLYAKWIANPSSGGYVPTPILRYTVHFETNGADVIGSLVIVNGSKITEPPTPTKEGFIFGGWYHDAALSQKWDYEQDRVTTNTTLYAKWIAVMTTDPKPVVNFKDISGHWAQEMIEELASQGIITGFADGSFNPNESIQRQHMALIFMRAFELEPVRELESFSDVSPNHANYEAIALLQQAGIVDGTNGKFNPSEPVTRAQMAKIVALALKIELGGTSPFQDVPSTHWSYAYVAALAELGIILGDNGKFNPDEPVTRVQFVAIMYRALHLKQEVAQKV